MWDANVTAQVDSGSKLVETAHRQTIGAELGRIASLFPLRPALVSTGSSALTFNELNECIGRVATSLRADGFGPNARIAVLVEDRRTAIVATVAIACAATAVPLDPRMQEAELRQTIQACGVDAIVLDSADASTRFICESEDLFTWTVESGGSSPLTLKRAHGEPKSQEWGTPNRDSVAFILQSSGTTGRSKLIPFSHGNMLAAAARMQAWFSLSAEDRCLSVAAPYYSHGLKVTVFTPLLTGGSIALPSKPTRIDLEEWFSVLQPTWYSAAPAMHLSILDHASRENAHRPDHRLRFILSGGAPMPPVSASRLEKALGAPFVEHYGLSEAAQMAANLPAPGGNRSGTCGTPWPDTLGIFDEAGRILPAEERGEVWVRGPTLTSGYLNDPDANRASFVDGWFRTGDIGSLDHDGYLTLHGRIKEVINRGGEKISPREIDDLLLTHPAVHEAAAFAVPHARLGEDVAAAVVLAPGCQAHSTELRRFLLKNLTAYKAPRQIFIVKALPKGKTGKIQRSSLTEMFGGQDKADPSPAPPDGSDPMSLETELLGVWRRLLRKETLTIDDDFFDSGGDSLLALEMLTEIDWILDPNHASAFLLEGPTIRKFSKMLAQHKAAASPTLLHFNPMGSRAPLYFFHGDFMDGGLYVYRLARHLSSTQPLTAIPPHDLDGGQNLPLIEAMAEERLKAIIEDNPTGPYFLGGHCNGALVAFEAARLLKKRGHDVRAVFMIDPPTVNARPVMRRLLGMIGASFPSALGWAYKRMVTVEMVRRLPLPTIVAKALKPRQSRPKPLSWEVYTTVMASYSPSRMDLPVIFYSADFDGAAWRSVSSTVTVVQVPGGHSGCVTTHVAELARHIAATIDACSADQGAAQAAAQSASAPG
ncbi:AMP-binding protein [Alsobacter sp. SYSU BS001988]